MTKEHIATKLRGLVVGILTLLCFPFEALAIPTAPLSVFGVGRQSPPGLLGELYRFNENGTMEQRWDIPESYFPLSVANVGTSLYVAEYGGAINRYDLNGTFLGQFADVSDLSGWEPNVPNLESDAAGNVYVTYGAEQSSSRRSFRLDPDGNISGVFSHVNLKYPHGIDAAANGDVYIANSASLGIGDRLFKFSSNGAYINDFAIPETGHPSDIAINEITEELYIADETGQSIHVYDLSSGAPIFVDSIPVPEGPREVSIEPVSGRVFGTYLTFEWDDVGVFFKYTGFEVSRDGTRTTLYIEDAVSREQSVCSIVAVAVPEPPSLVLMGVGTLCSLGYFRRGRKQR